MTPLIRRCGLAAAVVLVATGCGYAGAARPLDPGEFELDRGWLTVPNMKFQPQTGTNDCGAASLAMVLTHWGLPCTPADVSVACAAGLPPRSAIVFET